MINMIYLQRTINIITGITIIINIIIIIIVISTKLTNLQSDFNGQTGCLDFTYYIAINRRVSPL